MLENALLARLMQNLENYWTECYRTFGIDEFWDKDERFSFSDRKVKGQGHSMWKHTDLNTASSSNF